jgi:hypothetical protein
MKINRSELNATEQKAYDLIKPHLDGLGTLLVLEEKDDRIRLEFVSPNHFQRAAAALEEACGEAAKAMSCAFDVNLTTHWPVG